MGRDDRVAIQGLVFAVSIARKEGGNVTSNGCDYKHNQHTILVTA